MKIAVASEGRSISKHFGHCEHFYLFDVENNKVIRTETVANPGHRPGFLPNFLNDLGVDVIISGGMGGGAVRIFQDKNIQTIVGADGAVDVAVRKFLAGELQSTGTVCNEHKHRHECGEHSS